MGDSPNNRYVTRSAGIPAQLAEASTTIKQEPLDEAVSHGHAKEPNTANFQEASSSNCSSRDPLADEMEFGETSLSFQNAFFNVVGNEIKTENIIADEIEDSGDIVGSSTKRRKTCDEDSGEDSSTARSTRQSITMEWCCREASSIDKVRRMAEYNRRQIIRLNKAVREIKNQLDALQNVVKPPISGCSIQTPIIVTTVVPSKPQRPAFAATKVASKEELDTFDALLANPCNLRELHQWLCGEISSMDCHQRMHEAFYMLFDAVFLVSCSWTGRRSAADQESKIAFQNYTNVFCLLRNIAMTDAENVVSETLVQKFLRNKIKNAKTHSKTTGSIKSVCRKISSRSKKK